MKEKILKRISALCNSGVIKYCWVIFAILLVIHFLVKDNIPIIAVIFYSFPIILLLFLNLFFISLYRKDKKAWIPFLACFILLLGYWWNTSFQYGKESHQSEKNLKIMFRNLARIDNHPNQKLLARFDQKSPDVAAFVEAGKLNDEVINQYQKLFPEYTVMDLRGGMLLFSKGEVEEVIFHEIGRKSRLNIIRIKLDEITYSLFIVDIWSNPFFWKKHVIQKVLDMSEKYENVIIMGDFNTPYKSVFFDNYRKKFKNAFRASGTGVSATWPYGIPLLEIDHVWTSKELNPESMQKHFDLLSDHAEISIDFSLWHTSSEVF